MKKILLVLAIFLLIGCLFLANHTKTNGRLIGIIVPLEHESLKEIVKGFQEELQGEPDIAIKVLNAQGDMNIQRAIIEQLLREKCEIFVPIGTTASQMTMNLAKTKKIVCLAANLDPPKENIQMTFLNEEVTPADPIHLLKTAYPEMKKFTLVHSASEKVMKEIPVIREAAKKNNMAMQILMIQNLAELYTIGQAVAKDSEAIFLLKDHLIVSGIQTLSNQAEKRGIPVVASDEGSIIAGGAFAVGAKESEIGRQGAQMVKEVLDGAAPLDIGYRSLSGPFPLFINRSACKKQSVDMEKLTTAAEKLGRPVVYTDETL